MAPGTTKHPDRSGSVERPVVGALPQSSRGSSLGSSKGLPGSCDRWWRGGRPGVARWKPRSSRPRPIPSAACAQAPPCARVTCGRGRGGPSRLRRLWPPERRGREVGARTEEAETAAAPAGPGSEARGCMARPAWLGELLVLLLFAASLDQVALATGECDPRLVTATRGWGGVGRTRLGRDVGPRDARSSISVARVRAEVVVRSMPCAKSLVLAFRVESPGSRWI